MNIDELIDKASQKLKIKPDELKNCTQSGNIKEILKNLNENDIEKIEKILSDKKSSEKLLATPKAQEIIKKIMGKD
ncbi:MAG: hypothetical protein RsTaC01_1061 [Candidatus Paraimprobicoccus trichonymphae]|uniref:Uncharacterized protein n=1 Tax=Candidatus Paraimprobicoccus trichonymphae TaxID=3033793 RepID=A0AA48KWJ6_9FIRM|nr:MAG: hypothetical protein RsTaC01_1061 [Candidatus Paraimprobicoccus trichonymphae]